MVRNFQQFQPAAFIIGNSFLWNPNFEHAVDKSCCSYELDEIGGRWWLTCNFVALTQIPFMYIAILCLTWALWNWNMASLHLYSNSQFSLLNVSCTCWLCDSWTRKPRSLWTPICFKLLPLRKYSAFLSPPPNWCLCLFLLYIPSARSLAIHLIYSYLPMSHWSFNTAWLHILIPSFKSLI